MAKQKTLTNNINKRLNKLDKCTRIQTLNIILEEFVKFNKLHTSVIADVNGLILAEIKHPRMDRENLSAASGLGADFIHRFSDILQIGKPQFGYVETGNTLVWIKTIVIPSINESYILFAMKHSTFFDRLPKNALGLLGKTRNNMIQSMKIASDFIAKACKE